MSGVCQIQPVTDRNQSPSRHCKKNKRTNKFFLLKVFKVSYCSSWFCSVYRYNTTFYLTARAPLHSTYVWSIFIVLCSLGWCFFCPSAAAETRLHATRPHSHVASHQECTFVSAFIRLHLDQSGEQATEGCSLWFVHLKVIISHNFLVHGCTSNLDLCCLFFFFFIIVMASLVSLNFWPIYWIFTFCSTVKGFNIYEAWREFFMFDHINVCIGLDWNIYWNWF